MVIAKERARKIQTTRFSPHAPSQNSIFFHCTQSEETKKRERERKWGKKGEEYADSIQFRVRTSPNLET